LPDASSPRPRFDATQVDVVAWEDDGANCGVSFAADERWLVLAYLEEGRLQTNSCMRNQRLDGSDPDGETVIASLVAVPVDSSSAADAGVSVPMPVLLAAGVVAVVGAIGAIAFRRRPGDPVS